MAVAASQISSRKNTVILCLLFASTVAIMCYLEAFKDVRIPDVDLQRLSNYADTKNNAQLPTADSLNGPESSAKNFEVAMDRERNKIRAKCLKDFMQDQGVKNWYDIPCGKASWQRLAMYRGLHYYGTDSSVTMLKQAEASNKDVSGMHIIGPLDIVHQVPKIVKPSKSLLLVKDLLQHLPLESGLAVLDHVRASHVRYLAVTHYDTSIHGISENIDIMEDKFYHNNMLLEPFNLKNPVKDCNDLLDSDDQKRDYGNLLIFDMQQKPAASKKASKAKNVFENIAENNVWGDPESISGSGSTVEANKYRVKFLSKFMKTHQLTRIYDIPCGDANWQFGILFKGMQYYGSDISDHALQIARKKNTKYPNMNFLRSINLIEEVPPIENTEHSIFMFKEVLQHMPLKDGIRALNNIKKSGVRYLAITNHDKDIFGVYSNQNVELGGFYPNNMFLPPFNFPKPLADVNDELEDDWQRRSYGNLVIFDLHTQYPEALMHA